jgi:thioredoxin-related protein
MIGKLSFISLALILAASVVSAQTGSGSETKPGEFHGAIATVYPGWFKDSFLEFEEDINDAAAAGKRVMLLFHQDNCPYCNALVERNLSQQDIVELLQQQFDVIALNIWGDREVVAVGGDDYTEKSFAEALAVQFTPTLIFFNEQGKIILRLNGYLPPPQFRLALEYIAGKHETSQSYSDYVTANAPPAASGELNAQPFFAAPPYDLSAASRLRNNRPLAVFFEQKQCPNCDTLHRSVLSDAQTRKLIEQFSVIQLDMWSDTPVITPAGKTLSARDWARQLQINYAPSIVLFERNGEEIIRSEAWFKIFHTQSVFDYVLSGAYRTQPGFQRYLSARADALREQGIDVDIWR